MISTKLWAQPGTEVYLFDLQYAGGEYSISNPINLSNNPGYDNQPSFLPNGKSLLFVSTRDGQTDAVRYDIESGELTFLTETPGSEYSPTKIPGQDYFSTIVLEKDGKQLLWKYPLQGGEPQVVVEDSVIGYHCWYDESTLFSFVLGDISTLQQTDKQTGESQILIENVGRSLHKIPGKKAISFVDKSTDSWIIKSYDPQKKRYKELTQTLEGSEDYAWTPEGVIIMGKESKLYRIKPGKDDSWDLVVNLESFDLSGVTRLSVSPKGDKIAVVVSE